MHVTCARQLYKVHLQLKMLVTKQSPAKIGYLQRPMTVRRHYVEGKTTTHLQCLQLNRVFDHLVRRRNSTTVRQQCCDEIALRRVTSMHSRPRDSRRENRLQRSPPCGANEHKSGRSSGGRCVGATTMTSSLPPAPAPWRNRLCRYRLGWCR